MLNVVLEYLSVGLNKFPREMLALCKSVIDIAVG